MNTHNPAASFAGRREQALDLEFRSVGERTGARVLTSRSLFQGEFEIGIEHGDSLYRLKITRQGKLILNK